MVRCWLTSQLIIFSLVLTRREALDEALQSRDVNNKKDLVVITPHLSRQMLWKFKIYKQSLTLKNPNISLWIKYVIFVWSTRNKRLWKWKFIPKGWKDSKFEQLEFWVLTVWKYNYLNLFWQSLSVSQTSTLRSYIHWHVPELFYIIFYIKKCIISWSSDLVKNISRLPQIPSMPDTMQKYKSYQVILCSKFCFYEGQLKEIVNIW